MCYITTLYHYNMQTKIYKNIFAICLLLSVIGTVANSSKLTICTKTVEPFSFFEDGEWKGFSWDYWKDELFPIIKSRNSSITGYTIIDGGNNIECLKKVRSGDADLAHAAITKTASRELIVNFGSAWFFSGFRILTRTQNDFWATMMRIIQTLGTAVGLYIAVVLILSTAGGLIFMYSGVWMSN